VPNAVRERTGGKRLGTKGRYAVMAMVDLAGSCRGGPVALADIAQRQEISLSYLEQLFAKLREGGLVKSVRGPGGGYLLARPAESVRVSDIIQAVDESIRVTRCGEGSSSGCRENQSRCLTHDLWEELGAQIHDYLSSVTVADVVERRIGAGRRERGAGCGGSAAGVDRGGSAAGVDRGGSAAGIAYGGSAKAD
jgi:Rrf2 family iron-sulfur cluster assembly transcriptional regulator